MIEFLRSALQTLSTNPVATAAALMILGGAMLIGIGAVCIVRNTILATALFAVVGNLGVLTGMAYMAGPATPFGLGLYRTVPLAEWIVFMSLLVIGFVVLCNSTFEVGEAEAVDDTITSQNMTGTHDAGLPSAYRSGSVASAMGVRRKNLITVG